MQAIMSLGCKVYGLLDKLGEWLPQLGIRLLLAWEFWEAGVEKFNGENWFVDFAGNFPFPFNILPTELSWALSMWTELLGSIALVVGFATRFAAASLIILDLVAWYSVHAGSGYNVCSNGFKLPLIYLILFIPLLTSGAGKASIDYFIRDKFCSNN
jgi:putative oxidoreductase